jgi:hypothetical protein
VKTVYFNTSNNAIFSFETQGLSNPAISSYTALQLLDSGEGQATCLLCRKTYAADQLIKYTIGAGNNPFNVRIQPWGILNRLHLEKTKKEDAQQIIIISLPDPTWVKLSSDVNFQKFMRGYIQLLRESLKLVTIIDQRGNPSRSYYTCGQDHDQRNADWKPFRLLKQYCQKHGLDDYDAKELIEDRIGRRLVCECELVGGPA